MCIADDVHNFTTDEGYLCQREYHHTTWTFCKPIIFKKYKAFPIYSRPRQLKLVNLLTQTRSFQCFRHFPRYVTTLYCMRTQWESSLCLQIIRYLDLPTPVLSSPTNFWSFLSRMLIILYAYPTQGLWYVPVWYPTSTACPY